MNTLKVKWRRLDRWDWWNGRVKRGTGVWTWTGHVGPVALVITVESL